METITPDHPLPAEEPTPHALRAAIQAYLQAEESEETHRARLLSLPGGPAALERIQRIRGMQQRFASRGVSTETYFQQKRAESEQERGRDEARGA
jgi:hypothetical protein